MIEQRRVDVVFDYLWPAGLMAVSQAEYDPIVPGESEFSLLGSADESVFALGQLQSKVELVF